MNIWLCLAGAVCATTLVISGVKDLGLLGLAVVGHADDDLDAQVPDFSEIENVKQR